MEHLPLWMAAAGLAAAVLILLRRPLAALWKLALRSGIGLCFLWLFNQVGALIGVRLGLNLFTALILGALGVPGFGLLLLAQWAMASAPI